MARDPEAPLVYLCQLFRKALLDEIGRLTPIQLLEEGGISSMA